MGKILNDPSGGKEIRMEIMVNYPMFDAILDNVSAKIECK